MTRDTARFTNSNLWDRAVYMARARQCERCFSCRPLFLALHEPPSIKQDFWIQWFGSDPGQRMHSRGLALEQPVYEALMRHAGICCFDQTTVG